MGIKAALFDCQLLGETAIMMGECPIRYVPRCICVVHDENHNPANDPHHILLKLPMCRLNVSLGILTA